MKNWIDLSNLPHKNNNIIWKDCNGESVSFCYKDIEDSFNVLKRTDLDHVVIMYHEKEYVFPIISIQRCCLGRLFNFSVSNNFRYKVNDVLEDNYRIQSHKRLLRGTKYVKAYDVLCFKCSSVFEVTEGNFERGDRCPYCSHHKIIKGKTDLWTIRPDIALLLKDENDGYKYSPFSNKSVEFICNRCGQNVGKRVISSVSNRGLSCPFCSDGKSYPNKFMFNLLNKLKESFESEKIFDWCIFPSYDGLGQNYGIFDFVIENKKLIIEMDGGLGHGYYVRKDSRYSIEETMYRDNLKDKLAKENGYDVVRIDCNYRGKDNKYEICKAFIISSKLAKIYDLSKIDWKEIDLLSQKSILIEICNMYNQGISSGEISEILDYDLSSVIDYLHKGNELSLCNFIPQKIRRKK